MKTHIEKKRLQKRILQILSLLCTATITLFGIAGCNSWQKDVTVKGIRYSKFRYTGRRPDSNHSYSIGLLKSETAIGGVRYKGYLHLRGNGTVSGGVLAAETHINNIDMPPETWVAFTQDGHLESCAFPTDTLIQGHLVDGGPGGMKGARVSFYPGGTLKYFFAPADTVIQSVPCRGGMIHTIELFPNGELKSCTAVRKVTIDGKTFSKGSRVQRRSSL